MDDLQRCPFCGSKAQKRYSLGKYSFFAFIQCTMCGAQTKVAPISDELIQSYAESSDEAYPVFWNSEPFQVVASKWNNRYKEGDED